MQAVEAEGESLVDLLDTYMKANSTKAKPMEPFGGALFEMYNYAWTPPCKHPTLCVCVWVCGCVGVWVGGCVMYIPLIISMQRLI